MSIITLRDQSVHIAVPVTSLFLLFRLQKRAQKSFQCSLSFNYAHVMYWLWATFCPASPNLMANKADINLTMSENVMASLSLLSLVYIDARQLFSPNSPLILALLLPFITGTPNRWDRLTLGMNAEVHSLVLTKRSLCDLEFSAWLQRNFSLGWTF